jgi:membrane associated rhomboid family serine protease
MRRQASPDWHDGSTIAPLGFARPGAAVCGVLIATMAVYGLQLIPRVGEALLGAGELVPERVFAFGEAWRLVTYLLLHQPYSPWHVLFNMLALWMFGLELEARWGWRRFIVFYLVCGTGAALFSVISWHSNIIGASGAVLGLLTAYAWYYPHRQILLFFIIPMPVWLAVVLIGIVSVALARFDSSIAHLTHLGGILVALVWLASERYATGLYFRLAAVRPRPVAPQRTSAEQVDAILKKISQQGMGSLSARERDILAKASRRR